MSHRFEEQDDRSLLCITMREEKGFVRIETELGPIDVKIIRIKGSQVRVLYKAPRGSRIFRSEIVERMELEKQELAKAQAEMPLQ